MLRFYVSLDSIQKGRERDAKLKIDYLTFAFYMKRSITDMRSHYYSSLHR